MTIGMYDKVLLKTGEFAFIVEIYEEGKAFEADITGIDGTRTDTIGIEEIEKVL